jgi:hypothetical protein
MGLGKSKEIFYESEMLAAVGICCACGKFCLVLWELSVKLFYNTRLQASRGLSVSDHAVYGDLTYRI